MKKYITYNGLKFTRDDDTGYYLNSTNRIRLHRYVWETEKGEIPKGYEIHHIDHDKSNNNIENLMLIKVEDHKSYHAKMQGIKNVKTGHLDRIRNLTKEWHASVEGSEWHKKHYKKTKDKLHEIKEFTCDYCGKEYKAINNGFNRFCSNKCKSAWRRNSGIDDEDRKCIICGNEFRINKYSKAKTCSRKCAGEYRGKKSKGQIN